MNTFYFVKIKEKYLLDETSTLFSDVFSMYYTACFLIQTTENKIESQFPFPPGYWSPHVILFSFAALFILLIFLSSVACLFLPGLNILLSLPPVHCKQPRGKCSVSQPGPSVNNPPSRYLILLVSKFYSRTQRMIEYVQQEGQSCSTKFTEISLYTMLSLTRTKKKNSLWHIHSSSSHFLDFS